MTRTVLHTRRTLRQLGLALLGFALMPAALMLASAGAQAQAAWPSQPITLVVPFPPGGPTDLVARVLAQQLGSQLGQPVNVDNRPGANGNLGGGLVAKAAPDGYTVLYNTSSITLSPALYKSLSYDVLRDLAPVTTTAVVPLALVVHPGLPVNSLKEFVAYAKANPGKLSYGSAGNGNVTHLGAFQLAQAQGIEAVHIPYKGSAPADVDLVAGQIQFMTETINSIAPFVRDKRLKLLAVTTAKRISLFPDVPTLAEQGMPGFEVGAWQGVMVPARTPRAVIDRLAVEINKALQSPEVKGKLAQQGAEPLGSTPDDYAAYLRSELARWARVVKQTGITME
jgi:tripartite-type tricarboxylate transporter receptor subunit TctC